MRRTLDALRDPAIAATSQRFFKTAPGGYGEGDRFLGIRVPALRAVARAHRSLPLDAVVEPAVRIADRLLGDPHDLIQKAVGWMLREVGKRDPQRLEAFLAERYRRMPRTMLRYAIERLPEERRQRYLRGAV